MEKIICTDSSSVGTNSEMAQEMPRLRPITLRAACVEEGPGRRQAHDRAGAALFFECYVNNLPSSATNREAYEKTERSCKAMTGFRRFRTYGSFRSAYSQFCRRATGRRGRERGRKSAE